MDPMRAAAAIVIVMLGSISAQDKQDKGKRALPDPTNLKILKATTGAEIGQIMRTFTAGLGVQCSYCHVAGNYGSDENPQNIAARQMIDLTIAVNAQFSNREMR